MSKVLQERGSGSLPSLTETNLRDHVNSISTTIETNTPLIRHIGSTRYTILAQQNSKRIFEPRQATNPFPSRLYDDCYDEEKGSYGPERLEPYTIELTHRYDALTSKGRRPRNVMPLSTCLNLGLGELGHTKLTVELADRMVKHLKGIAENVLVGIGPTVEEDEVVNEPVMDIVKTRCDFISGLDDYPRIRDVVVGEPFYKASCVEARKFDRIITIRDGNDSVTYQMVWSNPRFKHLTNEKCNKIPPLLKVSEQDKMNGISHPYQKLKGFYTGVLNLGPEFIRDAKVEEWLTRGHISVHEME
ncbi:hypothetical protein Tco_0471246 [Tanacetum coccineum]